MIFDVDPDDPQIDELQALAARLMDDPDDGPPIASDPLKVYSDDFDVKLPNDDQ